MMDPMTTRDPQPNSIEGSTWQLAHGVELPAGVTVTARFGGGTMYGNVGGRRYRVEYRRDGASLRVGAPTIAGRSASTGEDRASTDFFARLGAVTGYRADGQALELLDRNGAYVLRFVVAPDVPDRLAGRWNVLSAPAMGAEADSSSGGSRSGGDRTAGRFLHFDRAGRVTGSADVAGFEGPARADDERLTLGPLALERTDASPDATDAGLAFVSALESVSRYRLEGDRLSLLDTDGQVLVHLERPAPG